MAEKLTIPRVIGGEVELLSIELLEEHARRLAALLSIAPRSSGNSPRKKRWIVWKVGFRCSSTGVPMTTTTCRDSEIGPVRVVTHPFDIDGLPRRRGRIPTLGEHTDDVVGADG